MLHSWRWLATRCVPSRRAYASPRVQRGYTSGVPAVSVETVVALVSLPDSVAALVVLDLLGIFVFAISGALVGVRKGFDVFGVLVLAGTTGLGGGFLRDVLIGATPPAALADWRYLIVPVGAGLLTFAFHPTMGRLEPVVTVFDAFGLALFCVTGALKAVEYGLGPVPAALMGMVTGIGGGMVRDVLADRPPDVFSGSLYATPALAGAAIAVALDQVGQPFALVALAGFGVCLVLRVLAIVLDIRAPLPRGPSNV